MKEEVYGSRYVYRFRDREGNRVTKRWIRRAGLERPMREGRVRFFNWEGQRGEGVAVIWLGHGSFLIELDGARLLIDPVFKKWMGLAPRRLPRPSWERVRGVEAALITHGHMDHLDERSLRITKVDTVVVLDRTERFLSRKVRERCRTVGMGEAFELESLRVTVVPALHGGWRYPWQRGYFACGYLIESNRHVLYACGDTAYGEHFVEIGRRWKIDTALLPIGAYAPRWFLRSRHMNPEEAAQAAIDLGAKRVIPFHFGTYRLSLEPLAEPMERWEIVAAKRGIDWSLEIGL